MDNFPSSFSQQQLHNQLKKPAALYRISGSQFIGNILLVSVSVTKYKNNSKHQKALKNYAENSGGRDVRKLSEDWYLQNRLMCSNCGSGCAPSIV